MCESTGGRLPVEHAGTARSSTPNPKETAMRDYGVIWAIVGILAIVLLVMILTGNSPI